MINVFFDVSYEIKTTLSRYNLKEELEALVVAIYGVSGQEFDSDKYTKLVDLLRESSDYAIMNINRACLFAALILIRYEYPYSKVSRLNDMITHIRSSGYRSSVSNYMAYALLEESNIDDALTKMGLVFNGIRKKNGLIIDEDDYMSSLYLSRVNLSLEKIQDRTKEVYRLLLCQGFKRGKALYNLSHMITFLEQDDPNIYNEICEVNTLLKCQKDKFNSSQWMLYPLIAYNIHSYNEFFDYYNSQKAEAKKRLGIKRIRTIQMNVLMIQSIWHRIKIEGEQSEGDFLEINEVNGIILLNLLIDYLYRERML